MLKGVSSKTLDLQRPQLKLYETMRIVTSIVSAFLTLPFHTHAAPPFIEVSSKEGKSFEARITASSDEAVTVKTPHGIEYSLQLDSLSNETVEKVKAWKPLELKSMKVRLAKNSLDPVVALDIGYDTDSGYGIRTVAFKKEDLGFVKSGLDELIDNYSNIVRRPAPWHDKTLMRKQEEAHSDDDRSPYFSVSLDVDWSDLTAEVIDLYGRRFTGGDSSWSLSGISEVYEFRDILENLDHEEIRKLEREASRAKSVLN